MIAFLPCHKGILKSFERTMWAQNNLLRLPQIHGRGSKKLTKNAGCHYKRRHRNNRGISRILWKQLHNLRIHQSNRNSPPHQHRIHRRREPRYWRYRQRSGHVLRYERTIQSTFASGMPREIYSCTRARLRPCVFRQWSLPRRNVKRNDPCHPPHTKTPCRTPIPWELSAGTRISRSCGHGTKSKSWMLFNTRHSFRCPWT